MNAYLETSAAAKLLVDEPESVALADHLDGLAAAGVALQSSYLLETELRRLAVREDLAQEDVSALLDRVELAEPSRSLWHEAGVLPGRNVRSLDALHIATAMRLECDEFIAYDTRQLEAARTLGLAVRSPA